jgi:hypothetical protein
MAAYLMEGVYGCIMTHEGFDIPSLSLLGFVNFEGNNKSAVSSF